MRRINRILSPLTMDPATIACTGLRGHLLCPSEVGASPYLAVPVFL